MKLTDIVELLQPNDFNRPVKFYKFVMDNSMLFLFHILIACAIFTHNNPTVFSNNMRSDLNR